MTERDAIEQLAVLLDGDDAPGAPSSLGALAGLATAVRGHAELTGPTSDFRSSLRAELLAAAEAPPGLVERARDAWTRRTAHLRTSARLAVATMTASSMIGSAGVAVAAQDALPGELLYGLKHLTEDGRMLLAADGAAEARLHLAFARERLGELRGTAGLLDSDRVVALLAEMDAHSEAGAEALLDGVPSGAADEVRQFTADQRVGLVAVLNDLPLPAKPVAEDSLELLRRLELTASGTTASSTGERGRTPDLQGLLDDIETATAQKQGRQEPSGSSSPTEDTGVDVPLTDHERMMPVEDCDCIELPRRTDEADPPSSSGDDGTEAPPKQEPPPDDQPLEEPSDELFDGGIDGGERGGDGQDGDHKTRVDSPISHQLTDDDSSRDEPGPDEEVAVSDGLTDAVDPSTDVDLDGDALEGALGG